MELLDIQYTKVLHPVSVICIFKKRVAELRVWRQRPSATAPAAAAVDPAPAGSRDPAVSRASDHSDGSGRFRATRRSSLSASPRILEPPSFRDHPGHQTILSRAIEIEMPKLSFRIAACSGEDPDYPASALALPHEAGVQGWQSPRFIEYPIELGLEFPSPVKIEQLQLLSHRQDRHEN